jgi:hypothetical protein
VDANLVEATKTNFNGVNELKTGNLGVVTRDKVLDKRCIIRNLGDQRKLLINNTIFFLQ